MYSIVNFEDSNDYSVVLTKWINKNDGCKTYFPPKNDYLKLQKILKNNIDANPEWDQFDCEIIESYTSYELCKRKCDKFVDEGTLESTDYDNGRKKLPVKRFALESDRVNLPPFSNSQPDLDSPSFTSSPVQDVINKNNENMVPCSSKSLRIVPSFSPCRQPLLRAFETPKSMTNIASSVNEVLSLDKETIGSFFKEILVKMGEIQEDVRLLKEDHRIIMTRISAEDDREQQPHLRVKTSESVDELKQYLSEAKHDANKLENIKKVLSYQCAGSIRQSVKRMLLVLATPEVWCHFSKDGQRKKESASNLGIIPIFVASIQRGSKFLNERTSNILEKRVSENIGEILKRMPYKSAKRVKRLHH